MMKESASKQTQREIFLAAARDVGATGNQKMFDDALKRIGSAKVVETEVKAKKSNAKQKNR